MAQITKISVLEAQAYIHELASSDAANQSSPKIHHISTV